MDINSKVFVYRQGCLRLHEWWSCYGAEINQKLVVLHDLLSEVYFEQLRVLIFLPTRVNEVRNVPLIEILLWKRVRSFFPSSEERVPTQVVIKMF